LISFIILIGLIVIIIDHIWYKKNSSINDLSSVYFYFKYPLIIRIFSILFFFVCYILSILFGIFFSVIIAFIISKIRPLSWFGNSTLAFFLYGLSCLIGVILCETLWTFLRRIFLSKYPKKIPMEISTISHINRLCFNFERHWTLLLIFVLFMSISIYTGYRSLYLILLWSIFICPNYLFLILFEFIFSGYKVLVSIMFYILSRQTRKSEIYQRKITIAICPLKIDRYLLLYNYRMCLLLNNWKKHLIYHIYVKRSTIDLV